MLARYLLLATAPLCPTQRNPDLFIIWASVSGNRSRWNLRPLGISFNVCASATQPRFLIHFWMDLKTHSHWFLLDFFGLFSLLVRRLRRFPNTYPLILIRRFPPRGAAVCALRTQWLLVSFLMPFSQTNLCKNRCWFWSWTSHECLWKINATIAWLFSFFLSF